jgi:cation transport ATPase
MLPPSLASAAMALSSVSVVLNSLRWRALASAAA